MRLTVVAVGRGRDDPARALFEAYAERLKGHPLGPLTLKEVEVRRAVPAGALRREEAKLLRAAVPPGAPLVALDERGRSLSSADFAARLGQWRDTGAAEVAFVIGGAEGLDGAARDAADLVLSLGAMTWPHLLVRGLLAEQLYRAQSILTGHPYHRA